MSAESVKKEREWATAAAIDTGEKRGTISRAMYQRVEWSDSNDGFQWKTAEADGGSGERSDSDVSIASWGSGRPKLLDRVNE